MTSTAATRPATRAAVLGSPIGHSLSPVLHTAAYTALGLHHWNYTAVECDEERLPGFLAGLDSTWAGLSLTMPLKRAVLPLLAEVDDLALAVGGANTVVLRDGRAHGYNTDVAGMVEALGEIGVTAVRSVVILGAGATAASALAAVHRLGAREVTVLARQLSRTGELSRAAERLAAKVRLAPLSELEQWLIPGVDLVVCTLPSGASDAAAEPVARSGAAVFDVAYTPWPTPLAAAVRASGGRAVGGFPMLLHQAGAQVELMTGRAPAPVAAMREAGERALAGRSSRA